MAYKEEFIFGATSGLIFGIFIITGQNIDSDSLLISIGDAVNNTVRNGPIFSPWGVYRPWLLLISSLATIGTIIFVVFRGIAAIFTALLGFFGTFLLLMSTKNINFAYISIIFLLIGGVIANS